MATKKATTALATKPTAQPSFKVGATPEDLQSQYNSIQAAITKKGGAKNAPGYAARLKQIQTAMSNAGVTPTGTTDPAKAGVPPDPQEAAYNSAAGSIANAYGGIAGQVGSMGAFNPGSFADQQNAAYQHSMDQFQRTMQPQFDQQSANFRQHAAEMGIPPDSAEYAQMYKTQISDPQQNATQNAMDSAYGQGLQAQNQGFTQAATQYQMPFQQLQSLSPGFDSLARNQGTQETLEFQGSQNALDRQQQAAMAAQNQQYQMAQMAYAAAHKSSGGGGGGGGQQPLTYEQMIGLQNNQATNNLVLAAAQGGMQPPAPTFGSGAASGLAQGIGAGVASGLMR